MHYGTCCARCRVDHRTKRAAVAHQRAMGVRTAAKHRRRRKAKTGFAAMSMKKRRSIARKGGRASARARGYR